MLNDTANICILFVKCKMSKKNFAILVTRMLKQVQHDGIKSVKTFHALKSRSHESRVRL